MLIPEEIIISLFLGFMLTPKPIILSKKPFAGLIFGVKLSFVFLPFVSIINYFIPLTDYLKR